MRRHTIIIGLLGIAGCTPAATATEKPHGQHVYHSSFVVVTRVCDGTRALYVAENGGTSVSIAVVPDAGVCRP